MLQEKVKERNEMQLKIHGLKKLKKSLCKQIKIDMIKPLVTQRKPVIKILLYKAEYECDAKTRRGTNGGRTKAIKLIMIPVTMGGNELRNTTNQVRAEKNEVVRL